MGAGLIGTLAGGLGSDWLLARTGMGRAMFLAALMAVFLPINIAYRLVEPGSWLFWAGVWVAYFQLGALYGPTFSTVQDLVPPQIRATVVAFYILMLNVVGLGFGITAASMTIDALRNAGYAGPDTATLVAFTALSALSIPLFYFAARRYATDWARLFSEAPSL